MAAWKRKALLLFPEIRTDLVGADYSIYMLCFDLLPMVRGAHEEGDDILLAKIYGYAEWCFHQQSKDLWNAVGVAFYEHLLDGTKRTTWPMIFAWLSPYVLRHCDVFWEGREGSNGWKEMLDSNRERMGSNYERSVYHTGEIDKM